MDTIYLAYVERGLHEELVAYIADQQGYYADEGVHVAQRDGCSWDAERLRHGATIGLGRALLSPLSLTHLKAQSKAPASSDFAERQTASQRSWIGDATEDIEQPQTAQAKNAFIAPIMPIEAVALAVMYAGGG